MGIHSVPITAIRVGALFVVAVMCGCASTGERASTKSAYQLVIPTSADRLTVDENQEFRLGTRIGTAVLPEYPASELSKRLPEQVACVEIDIGIDGHVFDSRPMYTAPGCPEQDHHPDVAFYVAAEKAVALWVFGPARICTFPDAVAKNDDCLGPGIKIEYVPIRLAFRFSFTQERGPHVTSRAVDRKE